MSDERVRLLLGDCIEVMRGFDVASVDSIVTDPPYSLNFMTRAWDAHDSPAAFQAWCEEWATECLRVLKPGGHIVAFGATRTYHRLTCALEDVGFEIRDSLIWAYGSGFPKSLDVSKAIDKARDDSAAGLAVGAWLKAQREAKGLRQKDVAALWPSATGGLTGCVANWETLGKVPKWDQWLQLKEFIGFSEEMDAEVWRLNGRKGQPGEAWAEREVVGYGKSGAASVAFQRDGASAYDITAPASPEAQRWAGHGTALKPSYEPAVLARKPLTGTVAETVLRHGTGALNIDGCRVATTGEKLGGGHSSGGQQMAGGWRRPWMDDAAAVTANAARSRASVARSEALGRWPPNLLHDGSPDVVGCFPETTSGTLKPYIRATPQGNAYGRLADDLSFDRDGDSGSAARFFPAFPRLPVDEEGARLFYTAKASSAERGEDCTHPTVKPLDLMRWLVRLVTPRGGLCLDPFLGSGTTGLAARLEGMRFVGIEREAEYLAIAERRMGADYGLVERQVSKPKDDAVQPTLFAAVQAPGRAK